MMYWAKTNWIAIDTSVLFFQADNRGDGKEQVQPRRPGGNM